MENSPPAKRRRLLGQDAEEPGHSDDRGNAMLSDLKEVLENVHVAGMLDFQAMKILDLLDEGGHGILDYIPQVLFKLVTQATLLIGSTHYIKIVQKVVEMRSSIPSMPLGGPLQCLVDQMDNEDNMKVLLAHQGKLLSLIQRQLIYLKGKLHQNYDVENKGLIQGHIKVKDQVLTTADNSFHASTKCLRTLIMNNEYLQPPSNPCTEWTEELISTLELLLQKGADPSWIPQDTAALKGDASFSALYLFFAILPLLSVSKDFLFSSLMEIVPLFECDKHFKNEKWQRTALHALTPFNWKWLYEHLKHPPADFFKQYKAVISRVAELYPQFIDIIDTDGKTPLHCFIQYVGSHGKVLEEVSDLISDIVLVLRSESNIDIQDSRGKTPLHYLAETSPVFLHESLKYQEVLFVLARRLTSASNKDKKDQQGCTPLHILIENYIKEIPDLSQEIWDEVWQCFISDSCLDIRDNQGRTVLHHLAENYATILHSKVSQRIFLALARRLSSSSSGQTILHIIARKVFF